MEYKIDLINIKFENIKEEVNDGKLLLFAEWEVEDLLIEAKELKTILNLNTKLKS